MSFSTGFLQSLQVQSDLSVWVGIGLSSLAVIFIPILIVLIRGAVKWTRTEDQLGTLVSKVEELVDAKDKVHTEILEQMRTDRAATDKRLRYIEEFWMDSGRKHMQS